MNRVSNGLDPDLMFAKVISRRQKLHCFNTSSYARIQKFSSVGGEGGSIQVSLTKNALTTFVVVFLLFFLVLSLFYRSQMVNEIYHFSRFQRGPNIFQGVQLFPGGGGGGGVQLLIPYRNPYNL